MLTPLSTDQSFALYRAEQVRELDRRAIEEHDIAGYTLMSRAGQAAFDVLQQRYNAQSITIICGAGNNAGDGYVVARLAQAAGLRCQILTLADPIKLTGDAAKAYRDAHSAQVSIQPFNTAALQSAEVIVDAILGTGLQRPVTGAWGEAISAINQQSAAMFAIDIPSGINADTGAVMGHAVQADLTVTFIGIKQGLLTAAAPDHCGQIYYDDLDVPESVFDDLQPASQHYGGHDLNTLLAPRPRTAHKGRHGHVLVLGGDLGMAGAARMAAEAAARCGAGLVSIATRAEHASLQAAVRPELMFHGADGDTMPALLAKATVLALGPGLGIKSWGRGLFSAALAREKPMVIDADGLNLLAEQPQQRDDWILTPHPGEAARLLDTDTVAIQADRFAAVRQLQQRYGGVVVLKGAGSLMATDKAIYLSSAGNPGMGSGGMGDVLSGVIAALLGQGLSLSQAAKTGVYLHAKAADLAAQQGERGLLASDLFAHLRQLINPSC